MSELLTTEDRSILERLRKALFVYGGHVPPCDGRPCECGFKAEWDTAQLPAIFGDLWKQGAALSPMLLESSPTAETAGEPVWMLERRHPGGDWTLYYAVYPSRLTAEAAMGNARPLGIEWRVVEYAPNHSAVQPSSAELWAKQANMASESEMTALRQLARVPTLLEAIEAIAVEPSHRDERQQGMSWVELATRNCKIARDSLDAYRTSGGNS